MKVEHKIIAAFAVGFVAVVLLGAATYQNAHSLLQRNQMVRHTYEVISAVDDVISSADKFQSATRGFLLTGQQESLQPYRSGVSSARDAVQTIRRMIADNPVQLQNLDRLQVALEKAITNTESEIQARNSPLGAEVAASYGLQDKLNMDQVRAHVSTMREQESQLLETRDVEAQASASQTLTNLAILLVVAAVLLGFFFVFIRHDLAVRRRADQAVRDSENKIRGVMDSAPDALLIADESGQIQMVNAQAEHLFGFPREDFTRKKVSDLVVRREQAAEDDPAVGSNSQQEKNQAIEGFRTLATRFDGVRQDGTVFPIDLSSSTVCFGRENVFISAVRDRSAQEHAEDAIRKFSLDLARSNAELERFAYVASHDLQEPLRMVSSYTQLLAKRYKGKLDGSADEFIGYAVDGASRMQKLINDLLALSRVGTQAKPSAPVDTGLVLSRVLSDLRFAVEGAGAVVNVPAQMPTVLADGGQIGQLFQNLVGNALKFKGEAAPQIEVSVQPEEEGSFWRFTFKDNGIGIEPQYFERIFVIFQRLHSKESYPGTGIGLAICKKIVERHGGRMWVESTPGNGSTFLFTLPAVS